MSIYNVTFDDTLPLKEQMELLKKYKYENCAKSKETLVLCNLKLVKSIVLSFSRQDIYNIDNDDLFQCGVVGLLKAIETCDIDKIINLDVDYNRGTWILYMKNAILNSLKYYMRSFIYKHNSELIDSLDKPFSYDDNLTVADIIMDNDKWIDPQYVSEYLFDVDNLSKAINSLSDIEKEIVHLSYITHSVDGKITDTKIADLLYEKEISRFNRKKRYTRSWVNIIKRRALKKIKRKLIRYEKGLL